ncbi:MAG: hypothetical protein JSV88_31575 [Candidatus Aminicenantes bacterium]|nr:MAG: hypothetical protein JSV88_31575 [Candidatus Aminicenantes bacterium]
MKRVLLIFLVCMVCFSLYSEQTQSKLSREELAGKKNKQDNENKIDSRQTEDMVRPAKSLEALVDEMETKVKGLEETIQNLSQAFNYYRFGFAFLIIGLFVVLFILGLLLLALYKSNKRISGIQQRLSHLQKRDNGYSRSFR